MKKFAYVVLMLASIVSADVVAQKQDKKPLSPEETVNGSIDGTKIEIVYCRPSARGRKIMGGVVPYGEVWRTGANANTTIEFDKPVTIEGNKIPAGKYALFTLPNENEWVIILNKKTNQWGAYDYDKNKDQNALQVTVKPGKTKEFVETFAISIEKDQVNLQWENTAVAFKVKGK